MSEDDVNTDRLDDAIAHFEAILEAGDRDPRQAALLSKLDQRAAALRDMSPEEWEAAVVAGMDTTGLTGAEVRNWFGRLAGKCAEDDATWTGVEGLEP